MTVATDMPTPYTRPNKMIRMSAFSFLRTFLMFPDTSYSVDDVYMLAREGGVGGLSLNKQRNSTKTTVAMIP